MYMILYRLPQISWCYADYWKSGLLLTADTEWKFVSHTSGTSSVRPPTQESQRNEFASLIPPLLSAIETRSRPTEDGFQCQTCLASIHWFLSEPGLATARLPRDIASVFSEIAKGQDPPSDYTTICMLKSVHMQLRSKSQEGDVAGTLKLFGSVVPWMHQLEPKLLSQPQMHFWSEQLLAHTAFTASDLLDMTAPDSKDRIDTALQAFRHWAIFSSKSQETARDHFGIAQPIRPRLEIWKVYYGFLSGLLQHGIDHHALGEKHTRLHQITELRRIESTYESLLLRITTFPTANENNRIIEEWVEQVMRNWEVLVGRSWPEAELGEGGRNAVGRNVLDVLYRAATKTFHSTLILRRLFQVHKYLADFDLAYKALDSYLELVERGKARATQSHQVPPDIDDGETVLRIIAEAIEGLCTFGRREEGERASRLVAMLQEWTREYSSTHGTGQIDGHTEARSSQNGMRSTIINSQSLGIAHRAIGIGTAFWALWTPISERRSIYQSEALFSLQQASDELSSSRPSLQTAYAQALLLAETRDLNHAIDCVKKALSAPTTAVRQHDYIQERRKIPFLHLLALLLSAKQDFGNAYQMCGAALDQFGDSEVLFGSRTASVEGSTNGENGPKSGDRLGLVDDMDGRERERLIEIRMTELALVEIVEGPEEAVNGSTELLSLFSRLFGHLGFGKEDKRRAKALNPPKSSAGTIKSLRGSLFRRRRHQPPGSTQMDEPNGAIEPPENRLARYPTYSTEAPTIQVTDEDSRTDKRRLHSFRRSPSHGGDEPVIHKLHKREGSKTSSIRLDSKSGPERLTDSVASSPRPSFETGPERLSTSASNKAGKANGMSQRKRVEQSVPSRMLDSPTLNGSTLHTHNKTPPTKASLSAIGHNIDHQAARPPLGHEQQPPEQDVRLPLVRPSTTSTPPSPQFPRTAEQIHAHGILVKVWLLVAGLYRRASLFEDSKEASMEASKAATEIETLVAAQQSSAHAFADPGWGGGKSSNEIWADVYSERAYLSLAKGAPHEAARHFEEGLMYSLDHARATVGLSNILLDIFEQKIPSEPPRPGLDLGRVDESKVGEEKWRKMDKGDLVEKASVGPPRGGDELRKTPENLNRLAARDRAYGLLSNLTKLGSCWDDSEAWFALARAHECSGQIEKAKEVLWWCVELEDKRPVRHWRNIGPGSYVL